MSLLLTNDLRLLYISQVTMSRECCINFIEYRENVFSEDDIVRINVTLKKFIKELIFKQDVYVMMFQDSHFNIYTEEQKSCDIVTVSKITAFEYLMSGKIDTAFVKLPILNRTLKELMVKQILDLEWT